jgi:hypothetical protein
VHRNYQRKEAAADAMYQGMIKATVKISMAALTGIEPNKTNYNPTVPMQIPQWLVSA